MLAKWGSYSLPNRKVAIAFHKKPQMSRLGMRVYTKVEIPFRGVITGTSVSDLQTNMGAMETAFATFDQDFILYQDDGTTETIHKIDSSETLDGTRVQFKWLDPKESVRGSGGEYMKWRSFAGLIEAELNDNEEETVEWRESFFQQGTCGAQVIAQEALVTSAELVSPQAATSGVLIQEGYGVGWSDYLAFPTAAAPTAIMARQTSQQKLPPIYGRHVNRLFPIRWRYAMALTSTAISGLTPTAPP